MNTLRGTLFVALVGVGTVLVPAEKSEAGLIDWLRCVFNPCKSCYAAAPACEAPSCPPLVQEGSYCNPCSTPCASSCPTPCSTPCSAPCPVSYVRRTYLEPRTTMTSQTVLEPQPTYVRRHYWDPCTRCYKTFYESATSFVKRRQCVPVTDYVQRSYLEPVSCVTPSCPTNSCPTPSPSSSPAFPPESTLSPSASMDRRLVPIPAQRAPNSTAMPGRRYAPPFATGT